MSDAMELWATEYATVLRKHLEAPREETLLAAYELGRDALSSKIGVLEMTMLHHDALLKILADGPPPGEFPSIVSAAAEFAREAFSPYEMAHRGASEGNQALRRINEILEEQMQRIGRELHDEAGQILASVHLALHAVARDLPPPGKDRIQEVRGLLDRIEEQLRRISHELRPQILDDLGLMPALQFLGDGVSRRSGIPVVVIGDERKRLPAPVETALYRIIQEALSNTVRHSRASRVTVTVLQENGEVRCSIEDNGIGFDPAGRREPGAVRGVGLIGIRERLVPLSGTLDIQSGSNRGTRMQVTIPVETVHA